MPPLRLPLTDSHFTLNAWGLAGVFGGEEAIAAMTVIPLFHGKRWLGWYNSPGSLEVARHFGRLAHSRYWEQIYPFTTKSPANLFGLDGRVGPKYSAALSGTEMQTGHLGYLVMERCKEIEETNIRGRTTIPANVALIELGNVDYGHRVPRLSKFSAFLAIIPIVVSIATGVMCALVQDWYSFSVILVGILASGCASITIGGSVELILGSVHNPAAGSPQGDGILEPVIWEGMVVIVKGAESAVNSITKGKFELALGGRGLQCAVITSAVLLVFETLAQLFLIPQGTLFGQLMFVVSLCISWAYNFRTSLVNRERLQADILFQKLGNPRVRKFLLGTRTTMTVFIVLLVFHGTSNPSQTIVEQMLRRFLPNDTNVWARWRKKVVGLVCDQSASCLELDEEGDDAGLEEGERRLLGILLGDAKSAYEGYLGVHDSKLAESDSS